MAEHFIKKGLEYYTKSDIYDNKGVLLLKKDQEVTVEAKNRLELFGQYDSNKSSGADGMQNAVLTPNEKHDAALAPNTKEFVERMNIRDNNILEKPNDILINLIFESKTKPWWIYINALSNYVDWLYTHSIDVAMISLMMAVKLGYRDEELTNLGIGTLLHDVGKLLVPRSIVQKPESLSDNEMNLMRQHCELGVSSLEGFNLSKEYTDIVMQHHERLDGSGYPKGLKGEEICLNARIVMIADSIDAITSYRPYRRQQTMDAAIKILRNEKGKYPQELISLLEIILE